MDVIPLSVPVDVPVCVSPGTADDLACRTTEGVGDNSRRVYFSPVQDLELADDQPKASYYFFVTAERDVDIQKSTSSPGLVTVVDKSPPDTGCAGGMGWRPEVDPLPVDDAVPDWEGKLPAIVTWTHAPGIADRQGYFVYRAIDLDSKTDAQNQLLTSVDADPDEVDRQFLRLNREIVLGTRYVDRIEARAHATKFYYRLKIRDKAGNEGGFSCTSAPYQLPDIMPPLAPQSVAIEAHGEVSHTERIELTWYDVGLPNVKGYLVERAPMPDDASCQVYALTPGPPGLPTMQPLKPHPTAISADWVRATPTPAYVTMSGDQFRYVDMVDPGNATALQPLRTYCYQVRTIALNDRTSGAPVLTGRAFDLTPPEPPEFELMLKPEVVVKVVCDPCTWNPPEPQAFIAIWRREVSERRPRMIAPLQPAESPFSYVDAAITPGSTYAYSLQAIDASGNQSRRSIEKTIVIPGP